MLLLLPTMRERMQFRGLKWVRKMLLLETDPLTEKKELRRR